MRCIIVGSDDRYAYNSMLSIEQCGHEIAAFWSGEKDAPPRRNMGLARQKHKNQRPLLRALADRNVPYRTISKPYVETMNAALDAVGDVDAILSCGSMLIFPRAFIDRLDGKLVNFHPALLPHYKGPAPLHALIANEEADTYGGMTLHAVSPGIDEGPIIGQRHLPLSKYGSIDGWYDAMDAAIKSLIENELPRYLNGTLKAEPQEPNSGSYYRHADVQMSVMPGQSVAQIEQQLRVSRVKERFPKAHFPFRGKTRRFVVRGPVVQLGPPTGAPLEVTLNSFTFDATDARVRLKHLTKPAQILEDIGRHLGLLKG
ncbi:MAG: formyltransferase family protein [Pseudomonadota bacterium]